MSGTTKYAVIETALCIGGNLHEGEVLMVRADEHDRELSALREELARKDVVIEDMVESNCDMGQFLAAAEQRNAELEAAIKPFADYAENTGCPAELGVYGSKGSFEITRADWKSIASIKPTESGASGSTCNQIREESGLPINNPCIACNNGACIDK